MEYGCNNNDSLNRIYDKNETITVMSYHTLQPHHVHVHCSYLSQMSDKS